jgi:integrase
MEALLHSNKPKLSASSVKTYLSVLHSLNKVLGKEDENMETIFNDPSSVISVANKYKLTRRKTIMSALTVLTTHDEKVAEIYRTELYKLIKEYDALQLEQKKTQKETENWIEWDDVLKVYDEMVKDMAPIMKRKIKSDDDVQKMQLYVLLSLFVLIPPRRAKDWVDFVTPHKEIDTEKDNYFDAKQKLLVFNSYKTSAKYGKQTVNVPTKLATILKKWIEVNPSDHLFFGILGKPVSQTGIAQWFYKIFGRHVSVNALRHSYLTQFHSTKKSLKSMDSTAKDMGHSIVMSLKYAKE